MSKLFFFFQEASAEGGKVQIYFDEMLKTNTAIFVVSIYCYPRQTIL